MSIASSSSRSLRSALKRPTGFRHRGAVTELPLFLLPALSIRYQSSSSPSDTPKRRDKERYNYNTSLSFSESPDPDHVHWRRVTAAELTSRKEPPTRVKMLVRDFIDDSLYNPNYGYFSRNATIFTPPKEGFDFTSFADTAAFQEAVAERYEKEYGLEPTTGQTGGLGRQVWHTPTELFKPYYAQTILTSILQTYKLNHFPHEPLILYEVGAGNGSFMVDSLLYLKKNHPEIYEKVEYRIIEISASLAKGQKSRAEQEGLGDKVTVINSDFFKWDGTIPGKEKKDGEACFVVALEVFDNFAHDMIRYDIATLTPFQAIVAIDNSGDFSLLYEPISDPLIRRVLAYKRLLPESSSTMPPASSPLLRSNILRSIYSSLPFSPNLTQPDFLPTKAILFLETLRKLLPNHRLLISDFDVLPDAVEGRNGPVVQTRYGGSMIPCETFLVKQGYFDIFFPTDFELLRDVYSIIMNSPSIITSSSPSSSGDATESKLTASHTSSKKTGALTPTSTQTQTPLKAIPTDFFSGVKGFKRRKINIFTHNDFVDEFAGTSTSSGRRQNHGAGNGNGNGNEIIRKTTLKNGENIMKQLYNNVKVMF
ncbi:uncharacterized protein I303_101053 [Kwoniella dejecticola CBS 10117]|uniref:type II protein arginine methyltransferase n=1 Tax=Kwoniella dejecticola CBS 10117 TaxID=1296121 RepID=A0A1A6AGP2_9TREE|nr:uncharacterized protein I303_01056 [Kwoniella dejecticola CBS 10117]OBR89231.1 hypothetical protein I303_01056 [Kwoniella dejecticola CBS 10117]